MRIMKIFLLIAIAAVIIFAKGLNAREKETPYTVVDTNQRGCYSEMYLTECPGRDDAFFGQDTQYNGPQPSYTDNGDGTITDNNTGLMWQKNPGEKMVLDDAIKGANYFNLAGHTDWRLPTIKELYSLILFSGLDPHPTSTGTSGLSPFIDDDFFDFEYGNQAAGERIIDSQFASSNVYVGDGFGGRTMFGVNFADGRIKGYGTSMRHMEKTFFVLYVRGNKEYGINDLKDNGNGTIHDRATNLTWQQADSEKGMIWGDALSYCENLVMAGKDDWRLPNAKELQSIVDYSRSPDQGSAAIDPIFRATAITNEAGQVDFPFYWTSTTHARQANGASAAYVSFGRGLGYMRNSWVDVHGAGSQRSDPKNGDPTVFSTGHGPQGDAVRIYNYARCVRDGAKFNNTEGLKLEDTPVNNSAGSQRPAGGPPQGGPPGGPPPEAFEACSEKSEGAACSVETPHGTLNGTCGYGRESELICIPEQR